MYKYLNGATVTLFAFFFEPITTQRISKKLKKIPDVSLNMSPIIAVILWRQPQRLQTTVHKLIQLKSKTTFLLSSQPLI